MDMLFSTTGFVIALGALCVAVVFLAPLLEALPRDRAARRQSYIVAAALIGSPILMIGLLYLVVRLMFD
jgi:hypothetical protein